jgi:5-methylcytosine-specific restriction endonuclease McrA
VPRGSPYGTQAWRRTRRAILDRDSYRCQLQLPGCTQVATTVHHRLPSSQYPHLFYDWDNLCGACRRCNFAGGREVQLGNRTARQMLNHLEQVVERQKAEIDGLRRQLEEHERPKPHRTPAIR